MYAKHKCSLPPQHGDDSDDKAMLNGISASLCGWLYMQAHLYDLIKYWYLCFYQIHIHTTNFQMMHATYNVQTIQSV